MLFYVHIYLNVITNQTLSRVITNLCGRMNMTKGQLKSNIQYKCIADLDVLCSHSYYDRS